MKSNNPKGDQTVIKIIFYSPEEHLAVMALLGGMSRPVVEDLVRNFEETTGLEVNTAMASELSYQLYDAISDSYEAIHGSIHG